MTGPTSFTETNALLAVAEGGIDEARRLINTMLPGERDRLAVAAHRLADLCGELELIMQALAGTCRWGYHCQCESVAYILGGAHRDRPMGICQHHKAVAISEGCEIHERPAEVVL